jgi:serine/threonine protein kinase
MSNKEELTPSNKSERVDQETSFLPVAEELATRREGIIDLPNEESKLPTLVIEGNDGRKIELLDIVGEGKNGMVWKARYQTPKPGEADYLAVKVVKNTTPLSWKKLAQEAQAMATLSRLKEAQHSNVIKLYDFFEYPRGASNSQIYLAMAFYEAQVISKDGMSRDEVLDCFYQMCQALEYVHAEGILHKDIKPDNILLTRDEANQPIYKLTDFGQAYVPVKEGGEGYNLHGSILYTAPELLRGDASIGPSADLYSLAAVIYELLTGRSYLPFTGDRKADSELILNRKEPVTPPHNLLMPNFHPLRPKISEIIVKALSYDPAQRYQNAGEMVQALKAVLYGEGSAVEHSKPNQVIVNGNLYQFVSGELPLEIPKLPANRPRPFMSPPLPPQGIFGREESMVKIFELLRLEDEKAANLPPVALQGMGGIGKTTLTIALSRLGLIPRFFPDGVLWVELGAKPAVRSRLIEWGDRLGLDLKPQPDEVSCINQLKAELFERRVLIIVDDVWQTNQGQAFNVGGPYARTLFTTRETPIAYDLATRERTLAVDLLSPEASIALLARLAPEALSVAEEKVRRLCEKLEFLPLALTLAGRYLAVEADLGPARLARALDEMIEQRETRLELSDSLRQALPEGQPASLWNVLGRSVERLNKTDQERFAMAGTFGGEPLTWDLKAAISVWDCSEKEAEGTVRQFVQRGLVVRRGERFWMHALLADYANLLLDQLDL